MSINVAEHFISERKAQAQPVLLPAAPAPVSTPANQSNVTKPQTVPTANQPQPVLDARTLQEIRSLVMLSEKLVGAITKAYAATRTSIPQDVVNVIISTHQLTALLVRKGIHF